MWKGKVFHSLVAEYLSEVKIGKKTPLSDLINSYRQQMEEQWKFSASNSSTIGNIIPGNAFLLQEHLYQKNISENTLKDVIQDIGERMKRFDSWAENTHLYTDIIRSPQVWIESPTYGRKTTSFELDGIQIVTRVDLALTSGGRFTIFDWKTSAPSRSAYLLTQSEFQAAVYQLWPHFKLGVDLSNISAQFVHFTDSGLKRKSFKIGKNMREYTLSLIRRSISRMNYYEQIHHDRSQSTLDGSSHLTLGDLDYARSEKSCVYCSFKRVCQEELE